jgi:hypothetical protein
VPAVAAAQVHAVAAVVADTDRAKNRYSMPFIFMTFFSPGLGRRLWELTRGVRRKKPMDDFGWDLCLWSDFDRVRICLHACRGLVLLV